MVEGQSHQEIFLEKEATASLVESRDGVHWRLSKEGRKAALDLWQNFLKDLPANLTIADLEELKAKARAFFASEKERAPEKGRFFSLSERSFMMRLEGIRNLARYSEMEATNSTWSELLHVIKDVYYPHYSLEFVKNFWMRRMILLKQDFERALEESESMLSAPQLVNLPLFRRYVEQKTLERLITQVQEGKFNFANINIQELVKSYINQYAAEFGLLTENLSTISEADIPSETEIKPRFFQRVKESFLRGWEKIQKKAERSLLFLSLASRLWHISTASARSPAELVSLATIPSRVVSQAVLRERFEENQIGKLEELSLPTQERLGFKKEELLLDPIFVYPGSTLATADILRRIDTLTKEIFGDGAKPAPELINKYINTIKLLKSAKELYPQAVEFRIIEKRGEISIEPLSWQEHVEVKEQRSYDYVVVGGELESITGAMRAAKKGMSVAIVYHGSLGGLSSDTGGNMRYFDAVWEVGFTSEQRELLHKALGMASDNLWSIPNGVHEKLLNYLKSNYPSISLIETRTLDSLHLNKEGGKIKSLITEEGIEILGRYFLDSDPEAVLSEKASLPITVETPNLGYGLVFDLENLDKESLHRLTESKNLHPERIMALAGAENPQSLLSSYPHLLDLYKKVEVGRHRMTKENQYIAWGFVGLAQAYKLFMATKEVLAGEHEKEALRHLNEIRIVDGFNVALRENEASFNSISYKFDKVLRQGRHKVSEFPLIAKTELVFLTDFLRRLTGNEKLTVRLPKEFYVRQSTFAVLTLRKYELSDLQGGNLGRLAMSYPLDARAESPRHPWDKAGFRVYATAEKLRKTPIWNINPKTATTEIANLFVVSKNSIPPDMPCFRIIQNLIGTAVLVAEKLPERAEHLTYERGPEIPYLRPAVPPALSINNKMIKEVGFTTNSQGYPILAINL